MSSKFLRQTAFSAFDNVPLMEVFNKRSTAKVKPFRMSIKISIMRSPSRKREEKKNRVQPLCPSVVPVSQRWNECSRSIYVQISGQCAKDSTIIFVGASTCRIEESRVPEIPQVSSSNLKKIIAAFHPITHLINSQSRVIDIITGMKNPDTFRDPWPIGREMCVRSVAKSSRVNLVTNGGQGRLGLDTGRIKKTTRGRE